MIAAIKQALAKYRYVHVVADLPTGDQKADHDPTDISSSCSVNLLVSFLLGVERGAFIGCNGWDSTLMDRPLGDPQGKAMKNGTHMWRNFSSGTSVAYDLKVQEGRIFWAE